MKISKNSYSGITVMNTAAILSILFLAQSAFIVNPALADFAHKYSNVSYSTVLLLSTITSLIVIPFTMLSGAIAGRFIRYKTLTVIAIVLICLGVLPYFFDSFIIALVSRGIVGIGIGLSHPFGTALISRFFTGQKRANLQGAATLIMNLAGVFYQVIAGWVCLQNVNYTWLVHLFALVPLVVILIFFKEPESVKDSDSLKINGKRKIRARLHPYVYLTSLAYGLMFMFASPVLLNMSSIVTGEKIGTSVLAGTIISMYSLGGIVSGSTFGIYYRWAKKYTVAISFLLILTGLGICFVTSNPLLLMLGVGLFGLGKFSIWPASMCEYSEILPDEGLTPASSIFVSVNSLGSFLASFSIGVIAAVSGNYSPRFPLLVGMVAIIGIGLVWSIYEITKKRLPGSEEIKAVGAVN